MAPAPDAPGPPASKLRHDFGVNITRWRMCPSSLWGVAHGKFRLRELCFVAADFAFIITFTAMVKYGL